MAVIRTAITENPGVIPVARSKGQSLRYTILASGPVPVFLQTDERGRVRYLPVFEGLPKYRIIWEDQPLFGIPELVNTGFSFFTNAEYSFRVELLNAAEEPIWTMLEVHFTGAQNDTVEESFRVLNQ